MRKAFSLSLIFLFLLASCSKEDPDNDSNSSNFLVGKWEYIAYVDEYDYPWTEDDSGYFVLQKTA